MQAIDYRMDANETLFLAEQLRSIESQTYNRRYPELKSSTFIPVNTSLPQWASETTFKLVDVAGQAKIIGKGVDDVPKIALNVTDTPQKVVRVAASWDWSREDMMRAQALEIPFEATNAFWVRDAVERQIDKLAALGDTGAGVQGFANASAISALTATTGTWSTATFAQIVADLNDALTTAIDDLKDTSDLSPNTLLLSTSNYMEAISAYSGATDNTALRVFANSQPFISFENIMPWQYLSGIGAGSTDRAILYRRDPQVLTHFTTPFNFLPQHQVSSLMFEQVGLRKTAGVQLRYLPAIRYLDGL